MEVGVLVRDLTGEFVDGCGSSCRTTSPEGTGKDIVELDAEWRGNLTC